MTGLTHPHGKKAAEIITRRAMCLDAIVEALYKDEHAEWGSDELADIERIIEAFGCKPKGKPERTSYHARLLGTLETLVNGLDEGETPATLLNYINLQARAVVEEATGADDTTGKLATEEQRAACHAGELLGLARSLIEDREAAGIDEDDPDDPLAALVRQAREITNRIDHPESTTPCTPSPDSSTG